MEFKAITPMTSISSILNTSNDKLNANKTEQGSSLPFADIYNDMIENVKVTQAQKEQDVVNLALGNTDDLHTIMINASKATTAMQLSVNVTNKVLSAYNEIIKMNI